MGGVSQGSGRRSEYQRITIKDVAALARVSTATVSHALNNKGRVDPSTRDRVIAAAEKLGYRPSRSARALRTQRTGLIALAVPTFERGPTQTEMLSLEIYMAQAVAAAGASFARNYPLLLIPPIESVDELEALGIDGGIVIDPLRDDHFVQMLESLNLPVVTIERLPGRSDFKWYVRADNERDTKDLLDHLASQGARRVAMLSLDADTAWAAETSSTYLEWCEGKGQEPLLVPISPHHMESSAYEMACKLLDGPQSCDAVYASAERFATGVIRAARERRIRIPMDLMLASGIDGWETRQSSPSLTAIDIDPGIQAARATEMLISRLEGEDVEAPILMPSHLQLRDSTSLETRSA